MSPFIAGKGTTEKKGDPQIRSPFHVREPGKYRRFSLTMPC